MTRLALVLVLLLAAPLAAQTLDDRVQAIARELLCPVCEAQTVAESDSALAAQMRATIREMLRQGRSRDEILAYFVQQFGEGVLATPPPRGLGVVLYVGPAVVLAAGAAALVVALRRLRRPG